MGLESNLGVIPNTNGANFITSTPEEKQLSGVIEILLPELPWVSEAIERAQKNKLDLIFTKVPVITPEDLIITKCFSFTDNSERFQDLDDLKEIFLADINLNTNYLRKKLNEYKLSIPGLVKKFAPLKLG